MRTGHLLSALFATILLQTGPAAAIDPPDPAPRAAPGGTSFLDHKALLGNIADPAWFEANIPFLDVPDSDIQQVYYYRWVTYKEHLTYTSPIYGWLSTEFLQPVFYGAPYGGVNAAAGHQTIEGRWLRNQQYTKDNINYWLGGPGQFPKPQNDSVNPDTSDWAHEYSSWIATAVWQTYLAHGDLGFTQGVLPLLVRQYQGWASHFDAARGLYWQYPVWDATELSPASLESSDPYHGGAGYRPTINAYQYGNARAIANIATLAGQSDIATQYNQFAVSLQVATQAKLYDTTRQFFYDLPLANNPTMALLDTREEEGFVPWMFEMPVAADSVALKALLDPNGFAAAYGPTTAERRSRWFNVQDQICCHWNGPSWPFETSQTLTGLANLLIDYPKQNFITGADYVNLLHTYAATQFKNGSPYVAEAHDADTSEWIYDTPGHSEDYNHSTYNDNVISGLIGLRGQPDNTLLVAPLAPPTWSYFALENAPYHGHNVSVLWDRTGLHYGRGKGLRIFIDGRLAAAPTSLNPVKLALPPPLTQSNVCGLVDFAVNTQRYAYDPQPFASYTFSVDNVFNAIDGIVYRVGIPEDSRWTSYASPNPIDYFGVNFQRPVTLREVRLTFYDDGGGVRVPASYDLQYWTGSAWTSIPNQMRLAPSPSRNALDRILFPDLTTSQIRVMAPNPGGGEGWGLSEIAAMSRPVFQFQNVESNLLAGIENNATGSGALAQQANDDGSVSNLWELQDAGGGFFELLNLSSHLVLGVQGGSIANSVSVDQETGTGASSQQWTFIDTGNGRFQIENRNSGLLLGVSNESSAAGAQIVQFMNNGTSDHLWLTKRAQDPVADEPCPWKNPHPA